MLGWRWRLVFSWALVLCISFGCVRLTAAPPSTSAEATNSLSNLRQRLWNIDALAMNMQKELESWKENLAASEEELNGLKSELQMLRSELQALNQSYIVSTKQLEALMQSYKALEVKFAQVSKALQSSSALWEEAYQNERKRHKRMKLVTILSIIGAVVAGGVVGYAIHN